MRHLLVQHRIDILRVETKKTEVDLLYVYGDTASSSSKYCGAMATH